MATLAQSTATYTTESNWLTRYKNYVEKAEFNRYGWAATAVAIQGCILSPALLLIMAEFGGGDWQFLTSMLCFLLVLVPVLSALPVKYIFPTFTISLIIHILMIAIDLV
ncbi:hypothetical protein GCM10028807_28720 [Spirosoma daeguense]